MCTLWQRFGRVARNLALRGRAVLLAEDKYFDAYKQAALDKAAAKRKAEDELTKDGLTKKPKASASNLDANTSNSNSIAHSVEDAHCEAALKIGVDEYKRLRLLFNQAPAESRVARFSQKTKVLEPVMDAFINANSRPGLGCHRLVLDAYFGNQDKCE
jgi:hypothetical protein